MAVANSDHHASRVILERTVNSLICDLQHINLQTWITINSDSCRAAMGDIRKISSISWNKGPAHRMDIIFPNSGLN